MITRKRKSSKWLAFSMLAVMPGLQGCILPIPTPTHGGKGVIMEESLKPLEPGKTTRADVLLAFGDPTARREHDRFFVYQWERTHGYLFWGIGAPGAGGLGGGVSFRANHYLGLEFTADNRLHRFKLFDGYHNSEEFEKWLQGEGD